MSKKKIITIIVLFAFIFTQLEQNAVGVLGKNVRQAALRPPIILPENASFEGSNPENFDAKVFFGKKEAKVFVTEVRKEKFFEIFLKNKLNCTIKLPRSTIENSFFDFFPYWTFGHCRWQICDQDVFFNFSFSKLADDLDLLKENSGKLGLKIGREDVDSSIELSKTLNSIGYSSFVELASIYTSDELISIIGDLPGNYMLEKAVNNWVEHIIRKDIEILKERNFEGDETDLIGAKEKIKSGRCEIYFYKNSKPCAYLVYRPWSGIALTGRLREKENRLYVQTSKRLSTEKMEDKAKDKQLIKIINGEKLGCYSARKIRREGGSRINDSLRMKNVFAQKPKSLNIAEWEKYLKFLNPDPFLIHVYLGLINYLNELGKNFPKSSFDESFDQFFIQSFSLLHSQRKSVRDKIYQLLIDVEQILNLSEENIGEKNSKLKEDELRSVFNSLDEKYKYIKAITSQRNKTAVRPFTSQLAEAGLIVGLLALIIFAASQLLNSSGIAANLPVLPNFALPAIPSVETNSVHALGLAGLVGFPSLKKSKPSLCFDSAIKAL